MAPMAILSSVLRVLSDFGDAAGWLIAALVLFAYGRRIIQENEKAHAALDTKIDTVAQALDTKIDTVAQALGTKIDTVAQALRAKIDTVAQALRAIAKDVSFLAGRQAERPVGRRPAGFRGEWSSRSYWKMTVGIRVHQRSLRVHRIAVSKAASAQVSFFDVGQWFDFVRGQDLVYRPVIAFT